MKQRLLVCCMFFLPALFALAEDTRPEEPDLVLPPMILEVEDPTLADIEAVIPEGEEIDLSLVTTDLPDPEEIVLPTDAFDIALPGDSGLSGPGSAAEKRGFFSRSVLGIGTRNHVIGDISLFMLGGQPRTRLRFHHEGMDGFGEHVAGEGFYKREDSFEGDLSYNLGPVKMGTSGSLTEEDFGLQGRAADYSNVLYRVVNGSADADMPVSERIDIGASGRVTFSGLVLAGDEPHRESEIDVELDLSTEAELQYLLVGFDGGYRFIDWFGATRPAHLLAGGVYAESDFPFALDVASEVGIRWIPGSSPAFPFSVSTTAYLGGVMTVFLSGGYRWNLLSYDELRNRFTLVDPGDSTGVLVTAGRESSWFVEGNLRYTPSDSIDVELGCDWTLADSRFQPGAVSERGLFPQQWGGGNLLHGSLGIGWKAFDGFALNIHTGGILAGGDTTMPIFEAGGTLNFTDAEDVYGVNAGMVYALYDGTLVPSPPPPQVSLGGYVKIGEGVTVSLDAEDLVSAFTDTPTSLWGGYEQPGFSLVLKTNLSL